jgi:eukaryotic-like serine/threonine-protein kinase
MNTTRICSECRKPLPPDAPEGLCPECLVQAGLRTPTQPGATTAGGQAAAPKRELPQAGATFGGYRIVRELGRGGMGAVYDAEHLESGRRVALKVLSHRLDSPDARARFLREGRLAASINHPNSVYVYGTEEIEGTPAIAMELIAGGTLQQKVEREGPLPVGTAVDAALQVIAGLEAAQAVGILHRDIKPANCFEDADGTVKIGDFGLSISTAPRLETTLTLEGCFLGTPAFSSPEQLRGEELNARSDIYAVGVTLFYLLTGHVPFEAKNMVQLLATVLEQPAPSPRKFRPALPPPLARVVLRCLEKPAGERFRNYDELRQALAPFASAAPVPAPLGLRFIAGALDLVLFGLLGTILQLLAFGTLVPFTDAAASFSPHWLKTAIASFAATLIYFSLLEGCWARPWAKPSAVCGWWARTITPRACRERCCARPSTCSCRLCRTGSPSVSIPWATWPTVVRRAVWA